MTNVIDGYVDQEIRMLKVSEIYNVYVEDGKVYFQRTKKSINRKEII